MLNTSVWMDDGNINAFIMVIRTMYLHWDTTKIWPIGNSFGMGIMFQQNEAETNNSPFKLQEYWNRIIDGSAEDEAACPAWRNLDYVSCIYLAQKSADGLPADLTMFFSGPFPVKSLEQPLGRSCFRSARPQNICVGFTYTLTFEGKCD